MIHAAGMVGLERSIRFSPGVVQAARSAIERGAPILCDARMVSEGITRRRLPADNPVICTLQAPEVPELAAEFGFTLHLRTRGEEIEAKRHAECYDTLFATAADLRTLGIDAAAKP